MNLPFEDVPYEADQHDNVEIPHEVVDIMCDQNISLLAAWRIYRGLSQNEVAQRTGLTPSTLSQAENSDLVLQSKNYTKLAKIYNCKPEQLIL